MKVLRESSDFFQKALELWDWLQEHQMSISRGPEGLMLIDHSGESEVAYTIHDMELEYAEGDFPTMCEFKLVLTEMMG